MARFSAKPIRIPFYLSPGGMGCPHEDVVIATKDGIQLAGWWLDHPRPRGVVLCLHGYLMNRCELTPEAVWLHQQGFACLLIDFRAHGKSSGNRTTVGRDEVQDVVAAREWIQAKMPLQPCIALGSSMGAAAAALATKERPELFDGLILDSCYSRLDHASDGWWDLIGGRSLSVILAPVKWLTPLAVGVTPWKVDVADALRQPGAPVLLIHGTKDTLAAPSEAERNLVALGSRGQIVWFEGYNHSEGRWLVPELYRKTLASFLDRLFPLRS